MPDIADQVKDFQGSMYLRLKVNDLSVERDAGRIQHYAYEIKTALGIIKNPDQVAHHLGDQKFTTYEDNWGTGRMLWNNLFPLIYSDSLELMQDYGVYRKRPSVTFPPSKGPARVYTGRTVYQTPTALVIGNHTIGNILAFDNEHGAGHWATMIANGILRDSEELQNSPIKFLVGLSGVPLTEEGKAAVEEITDRKVAQYFFTQGLFNLYKGMERVDNPPTVPDIRPIP